MCSRFVVLVVDILSVYLIVCHLVFYVFFFFQAEDGIRDLVRSRGLGDVYKRQAYARTALLGTIGAVALGGVGLGVSFTGILYASGAVSYTHLTLPTSDLV